MLIFKIVWWLFLYFLIGRILFALIELFDDEADEIELGVMVAWPLTLAFLLAILLFYIAPKFIVIFVQELIRELNKKE